MKPRVSPLTRFCAGCGLVRNLSLVLTCVRNVYAYRWLCPRCAAKATVRV